MEERFCTQCGKSLSEEQRFCPDCGAAVASLEGRPAAQQVDRVVFVKKKTPGKGLGISSMVLGIIGLYLAIELVIGMPDFVQSIKDLKAMGWAENASGMQALPAVLVYSVLPILALIFGGSAIGKKYKNGISISGVVMGVIGLIGYIVSAIMLLSI